MMSSSGLLDEARRVSGLADYGDMSFAEGLSVLIKSINEEAELTSENEALVKEQLLRVLSNRLRMQHDLLQHPEILDEEILPPVFITSMPRTGSTKLHRMLAATQDFNAMTYWQAFNFAPFTESEGQPRDPRIAAAEEHLQWLYQKAPVYQQLHPMYAEEIEEEMALLDAGFNSLYQYAALLNVPSYVQWVFSGDGLQVFRDLRRLLQYMQWQHHRGKKRRWLLKTPSLLGRESAFAEVFVGADFIVTHRHPEKTLASGCSLFCGIRKLYNEQDYSQTAGAAVLYTGGETIKGHLQWRDEYPPEKVLDVAFDEVIGDVFELLTRIYAFLGLPFTQAKKDRVLAWIELDARREHFPNTSSLSDFGLTRSAVDERFSDYLKRYSSYM